MTSTLAARGRRPAPTNDDRRRHGGSRAAFARGAGRRAGRRSIPYVVAGYPDRRGSLRRRLRGDRRRRRPPRDRPAVLGSARRRCDAPARIARGAPRGRDVRAVARARRRASPRPAPASRSCRWATRTSSSAAATAATAPRRSRKAGAAGVIVADLTPDEGAPVRGRRRGRRARGRLPRRPDDLGRAGAPRSPPGAAASSTASASSASRAPGRACPSTVRRLVADVRAVSPVPVAVGFGVSKPAHVRALAAAGADGVIVASALVDALGPDGTRRRRDGPARGDARRGDPTAG